MAEALLRRQAGDRFDVYSAGLEPKGINPYTVRVMAEIGVPLDGHRSKPLSEYIGRLSFGYVITLCGDADARCPSVFPGVGQRLHWGLQDPAAGAGTAEQRLAKFREVRDEIEERLREWLAGLGPVAAPSTGLGGHHGDAEV
jgi:arsenate reductase